MRHGHKVYSVSTYEKRLMLPTELAEGESYTALHVRTGNMTGCGMIEKGLSTLMIGSQYRRALHRYLSDVPFDLIIYSTPPITLAGVVSHIKKKTCATTYLLLKDIFPQNAVDIGVMRTKGLKGLLYRYFRKKEKQLYRISDRIGCMSDANREYLLQNEPWIPAEKVEISPNCMEVREISASAEERLNIREKYGIPADKKVFVYGGNLGKPQDIPFIINCLRAVAEMKDAFFLIVGKGSEYEKLRNYLDTAHQQNAKLIPQLPKDEYDTMLAACDVGLIFLDHRFTIPNFPSRLLTYMQARLPVIACTDTHTDVGSVMTQGGFGWWCESNSPDAFAALVKDALKADLTLMGNNAHRYLCEHYSAEQQYENIMRSIGQL